MLPSLPRTTTRSAHAVTVFHYTSPPRTPFAPPPFRSPRINPMGTPPPTHPTSPPRRHRYLLESSVGNKKHSHSHAHAHGHGAHDHHSHGHFHSEPGNHGHESHHHAGPRHPGLGTDGGSRPLASGGATAAVASMEGKRGVVDPLALFGRGDGVQRQHGGSGSLRFHRRSECQEVSSLVSVYTLICVCQNKI